MGVDTDGRCAGFDAGPGLDIGLGLNDEYGIFRAEGSARPRGQRSSYRVFRIPDDDRHREAALRGEGGAGEGGQGLWRVFQVRSVGLEHAVGKASQIATACNQTRAKQAHHRQTR